MKIYVASSWRNETQPSVVRALRDAGHEVYDFHESKPFHWSQIDSDWESWTAEQMANALEHDLVIAALKVDRAAMEEADAFVYVTPCGKSASLEAGWAAGKRKPLAILLGDGEPEVMYRLADSICLTVQEVVEWAKLVNWAKERG